MKNLKQCYLGAIIFAMSAVVQAQAWPSKPLNLIVPFPPGGATDILGRVLSESLPSKLGQPAVVENKPGGSTVIGVMAALRAPADGYTVLVSASSSFVVLPALRSNLPYDVEKDIYPINLSVTTPLVVVTSADKPYMKLSDLIAQAKAKPKSLRYTSYGPGTTPHLATEIFAGAAQIDVEPIPYKGSSDSILALMRGDADFGLETIAAAGAQIKAGKLRALAVTSPSRSRFLPEVPGLDELHLPAANFEVFMVLLYLHQFPSPLLISLQRPYRRS